MRNQTSDLRIPRSDALPVSHRDSTVSEVYYEVHHLTITHGNFLIIMVWGVTTFVNTHDGFDSWWITGALTRTLKKDKYWHTVKRFCNLRLEKKQKINSWKRHALYDAGLSYARNRWEFERVVRNSMGKETWSIYIAKYSDIWKFYPSDYLNLLTPWVPFVVFGVLCRL